MAPLELPHIHTFCVKTQLYGIVSTLVPETETKILKGHAPDQNERSIRHFNRAVTDFPEMLNCGDDKLDLFPNFLEKCLR